MLSLIDRARNALRRPSPSASQLAAAVDDARAAEIAAREAVDRQAAVVQAGFLDAADKRAADRAKLAELRAEAEDAAAVLHESTRRHAAAASEEEQSRRRQFYESARASSADAAAALARDYPKVVRDALKVLAALAAAQRDVEVANSQLPEDMPALLDPELVARGSAGTPRLVLSETTVVRWARLDHAHPVPDDLESHIVEAGQRHPAGWGRDGREHDPERSGTLSRPSNEPAFLRARFVRREVQEWAAPVTPLPLAIHLRLPSAKGDGLAWGVPEPEFGASPIRISALSGAGRPDQVLDRLAQANAAPPRQASAQPAVRVEYELLGYVGATPLQRNPHQDYSRHDIERAEPEIEPRAIADTDASLVPTPEAVRAARAAEAPTRLAQQYRQGNR